MFLRGCSDHQEQLFCLFGLLKSRLNVTLLGDISSATIIIGVGIKCIYVCTLHTARAPKIRIDQSGFSRREKLDGMLKQEKH